MTRRRLQPHLIFGVSLLIFLRFAFGLSYSLAVPAWESYDEPGHFGYAVHIAATGRLPTEQDAILNPERIQPPLYYLALAKLLQLSESQVMGFEYPEQNPYFYYGTSGVNYAIHTLSLTPLERQIETSLRFARFLTLLFSLLGVAFAWKAARKAFPRRRGAAFIVAALFALWPQVLFNSSVVSNDGIAAVMGSLITWQLLAFRGRRASVPLLLLCLLTIGIGTLVKLNLLLLVIPLGAAVFFTASPILVLLTMAGGVALVFGSLWLLQLFPSVLIPIFDTIGGKNIYATVLDRVQRVGLTDFVLPSLRYAFDSSFGLFGWGNLALPSWVNGLWAAAIGLSLIGLATLVLRFLWGWPKRLISRAHVLITVIMLASVTSGAVFLSMLYLSIHLVPGRYLLPALSGVLIVVVGGWTAIRLRWFGWLIVLSLVVLGIAVPPLVITPAYAIPPEVQIEDIPRKENVDMVSGVRFLGWNIPNPVVYPGEDLYFNLYWQAAYPLRTRFYFKIELVAPDGQGYAILETIPGAGNYLATDWAPRRTFRDSYKLRVRKDYPAPSLARLRVTVLPAIDGPEKFAEFGEVAVHLRTPPELPIPLAQSAKFRDNLLLRSNRLEFFSPTRLLIYLTWQAQRELEPGTVFVHILCGLTCAGDPIAQIDHPPRDGAFPFQWWLPGEAVADIYELKLPDKMAPGQYPLRVGVYDSKTPERLRWTVDYFGNEDGLLVAWIMVDENNQRRLNYTYPR